MITVSGFTLLKNSCRNVKEMLFYLPKHTIIFWKYEKRFQTPQLMANEKNYAYCPLKILFESFFPLNTYDIIWKFTSVDSLLPPNYVLIFEKGGSN